MSKPDPASEIKASVFLTRETRAQAEQAARDGGLSFSRWVEQLIRAALKRKAA